ncbi:MAG TPA: Nramp family divalent metal transporter [Caldimonas sp.]|jgi:manganese transport protein|nr:Nramp family divalent metal transporter [Caldimonas sp.]HEV7575499.1 Nramp family divalent metal transporter [Caldimonas sp.]
MNSAAVGAGNAEPIDRLGTARSPARGRRSNAAPRHSPKGAAWRRMMVFFGPGYLVAVGYMDPGNWATSLAGGSQFGYELLSVVLVSNLMAMLFQAAAVRLGIAAGVDLAQACRQSFPPRASFVLWLFCEVAIVACNLAEVIGMAIGLNLLFGLPLLAGVIVTLLDVMLLLALQRRGFRWLEAAIIALVAMIGICFAFQIAWLQPELAAVLGGFVPQPRIVTDPAMLYLAVGIVGATVMPHNLYLHSSLVQTRRHERSEAGKREAIRFATVDSTVALGLALLINAAIMVLAAGAFHRPGVGPVGDLAEAHRLLSPLLGVGGASALFGVALICSGLSASVTGTLAGQIVMEGFLEIRVSPAARALLTRSVAIVPAIVVIGWYGSAGANSMLVFSQVILSLQLPFAIVPLLLFTTRRRQLGRLAFGRSMSVLLWAAASLVIALNVWMLQRLLFA